jgi:hypothetical protein
MKTEEKNKLLGKYYKGETTLEEELRLKTEILAENTESPQKDIFDFYRLESRVPENLEPRIFDKIEETAGNQKRRQLKWFRITSVAATVAILLTAYLGYHEIKNTKMENQFFVMEQALFHISESIQPEEQEDMLVLWVDDDVEIIIH